MSDNGNNNYYQILDTGAGNKILENIKIKITNYQNKAFKSKDPQEAFSYINKANALKELYDEFYYNSKLDT